MQRRMLSYAVEGGGKFERYVDALEVRRIQLVGVVGIYNQWYGMTAVEQYAFDLASHFSVSYNRCFHNVMLRTRKDNENYRNNIVPCRRLFGRWQTKYAPTNLVGAYLALHYAGGRYRSALSNSVSG